MRDFKELAVWKKSHKLTLDVYRATGQFPTEERYGLTAQLRRAVASIPTNIAEGCGHESEREFARYLSIAAGSASEAEYQLLLARDLGYLPLDTHNQLYALVTEVKKMLGAFRRKLTAKS